jgi:glycosyltransferase involved in cell wall biosynthesis
VLGTDAGGTKEIVQHGVTGLLHPVGRNGTEALAENMLFLLKNPDVRMKMGEKGRELVINKYLKNSTYNKLALVLAECMRT